MRQQTYQWKTKQCDAIISILSRAAAKCHLRTELTTILSSPWEVGDLCARHRWTVGAPQEEGAHGEYRNCARKGHRGHHGHERACLILGTA